MGEKCSESILNINIAQFIINAVVGIFMSSLTP